MESNITLKLNMKPFKEIIKNCDMFTFSILNKDDYIGSIDGSATGHEMQLDFVNIELEYQRKGFGTLAIKKLKEICKEHNLNYIYGECTENLIGFYTDLGAEFYENEEERDLEDIYKNFSINLKN